MCVYKSIWIACLQDVCVFVYRVQTLSLWHDERDYLQPLVHLNEVMSGEEGGALPLPSYTPLIRAGWGGVGSDTMARAATHTHNTLMDWLKVHLVKWLWLLRLMERSRVRDRGREWQDDIQKAEDDIQRGNKTSEMMGKINNNCKSKITTSRKWHLLRSVLWDTS